jgi:hypothetical protein
MTQLSEEWAAAMLKLPRSPGECFMYQSVLGGHPVAVSPGGPVLFLIIMFFSGPLSMGVYVENIKDYPEVLVIAVMFSGILLPLNC